MNKFCEVGTVLIKNFVEFLLAYITARRIRVETSETIEMISSLKSYIGVWRKNLMDNLIAW